MHHAVPGTADHRLRKERRVDEANAPDPPLPKSELPPAAQRRKVLQSEQKCTAAEKITQKNDRSGQLLPLPPIFPPLSVVTMRTELAHIFFVLSACTT